MKAAYPALLWAFRVIVGFSMIYLYNHYLETQRLELDEQPEVYNISLRDCHQGHGASVYVLHDGKEYEVELSRKRCQSDTDQIELYFSRRYDFFHVPGSDIKRRQSILCLVLLLMSFIPAEKIRKKLKLD